jgi:hypothetical protein
VGDVTWKIERPKNSTKGEAEMAQVGQSQKDQLKAVKEQCGRMQKQLQALYKKTGYEDLEHGVLALEIAQHTIEETLEHTGLGGEIQRKANPTAHRKAKEWQKVVNSVRVQSGRFLKTHPSEDLETALKALAIAEGSLEEVAEHYE